MASIFDNVLAAFDDTSGVYQYMTVGNARLYVPVLTAQQLTHNPTGVLAVGSDGTIYKPDGSVFSGSGGSSAWGGITGTLSAQTDLQTALNAKATPADITTALAPYQTTAAYTASIANYSTTAQMNTAISAALASYVTSTSLSSTLASYVTNAALSTTLASYVTSSSLTTTLSSYATTSALTTGLAGKAALTQSVHMGGTYIPSAADGKLFGLLIDVAHTATKLTAKTDSGTCTLTILKNGIAMTGGALSVSSTRNATTITALNALASGDELTVVASGSASPVNLELTITGSRVFA